MTQIKQSKAAHDWVRSHYMPVPKVPCAYELEIERLGLQGASLEELRKSSELRTWIQKNKETRFVPEVLLRKTKEQTEYDSSEDERRVPRLSLEDVREALAANAEQPQMISTR